MLQKRSTVVFSENSQTENLSWMTSLFFSLTHSTFNDNGAYDTSDVFKTQPDIKYATKAKLEDKMFVCIELGLKTLSRPFSLKSGLAVNLQRHLNNWIHHRLILYIHMNYNGGLITSSGQTWSVAIIAKSFQATFASKTSLS